MPSDSLPIEFPTLKITPSFSGMLSPTELLRSEGSIQFGLPVEKLYECEGLIVFIAEESFLFFIGVGDGYLMFARGEDMLRLPLGELERLGRELHVIIGWTRTSMLLSVSRFGSTEQLTCECHTAPYAPPPSLLDWARRLGLAPIIQYETKEAFYSRVFVALGSMEAKLESVREPSCYWDLSYEGNSVMSRTPKRERDLHSIIQSVLSDHLFLSSIEVIPEHHTAAGSLDFLLVGKLASGELPRVCVEFKNAHSRDFMRGLTHQLPAYLVAAGAEIGAYCALDFYGPWLPQNEQNKNRMAEITVAIRNLGNQRNQYPIQYFAYHLGKKVAASRL